MREVGGKARLGVTNDEEVRRVVYERSLEKGIISENQEKWLQGIFERMLIPSLIPGPM